MIGRIFRVIFGFVLACLAAGLTMVLFVFTPLEVVSLKGDRMVEVGLLALAAAACAAAARAYQRPSSPCSCASRHRSSPPSASPSCCHRRRSLRACRPRRRSRWRTPYAATPVN